MEPRNHGPVRRTNASLVYGNRPTLLLWPQGRFDILMPRQNYVPAARLCESLSAQSVSEVNMFGSRIEEYQTEDSYQTKGLFSHYPNTHSA